ncbi:MAG TPA: X2-like carbohydrate binding domain-containing protein, partial [Clostridia bacterium]
KGASVGVVRNGSALLKIQDYNNSPDYIVSGNVVTIKKSYLTYFFNKFNSPDQKLYLTFDFISGNDLILTIDKMSISNIVTCDNPFYDPSSPQDITVNITGSALNAVKNGPTALTSNDYSISGSTVTIKKSYLAYFFNKFNEASQKLLLSFDFSSGNDPVLMIKHIIIPYDNSVLTKVTDNITVNNFTSNSMNGYNFNDMVPLSDGWVIASDAVRNSVMIVNGISGEIAKEYKLNSEIRRIDFNPEKGEIIASQASNNIALIDAVTGEIKYISTSGPAIDITFAKGNDVAILFAGKISILDWTNGRELTSAASCQNGYLACDRVTNSILVGSCDTDYSSLTKFVFKENTNQLEKKEYAENIGYDGRELAISPDGLHSAFTCGVGNGIGYSISDIDATNIKNTNGEWFIGTDPVSAAFSKDSKYLIASEGTSIRIFDVKTHMPLNRIADLNSYISLNIRKVCISNGGRIAFAETNDGKLLSYLISGE